MKTARVRLDGDALRFVGTTGSGHRVITDGADGNAGPRPTELLLVSLAACSAMDVISILRKKRQAVDEYSVRVDGLQRAEHPKAFTELEVVHIVRGAVDPAAVRRAVELSATKYCSVGATLGAGTPIRHAFQVEQPDGRVVLGEVCVTGPCHEDAEAVPA